MLDRCNTYYLFKEMFVIVNGKSFYIQIKNYNKLQFDETTPFASLNTLINRLI